MRFLYPLAAGVVLLVASCATTDPSVVGSKPWYEQRMVEIQTAYDGGELTIEEYLRLKNEADDIRSKHRASNRPRGSVSFGVGVYSHD